MHLVWRAILVHLFFYQPYFNQLSMQFV